MDEITPVSVLVPPALAGLLSTMPHPAQHWPRREREAWRTAFMAVLDMVYSYPDPPDDPLLGAHEPGDIPKSSVSATHNSEGK